MLNPEGRDLRIAGASIAVIAALIQALLIGAFWWRDPGSVSCDHLAWGHRLDCLARSHLYLMSGFVALVGWCLAAIGLLLARFLTLYVSVIVPGGALASSIWMLVRLWPRGPVTQQKMMTAIGVMIAIASFYWAPVTGIWLAGYGARRRRRSRSRDLKAAVRTFD